MLGDSELVSCQGDRSVQVIEQQGRGRPATGTAFQFNQCFGVKAGAMLAAVACCRCLTTSSMDINRCICVRADGPGKTYTITGRSDSILKYGSGDASDGIVIRSVEALFDKIRGQQRDGLSSRCARAVSKSTTRTCLICSDIIIMHMGTSIFPSNSTRIAGPLCRRPVLRQMQF